MIFDEHTTIDAEKRTVQIHITPAEFEVDNAEKDPGDGDQAAPEVQQLAVGNPAAEIAEPRRDLDREGQVDANQKNVEAAREYGGAAGDDTRDLSLRRRDNLRCPARYTANIAVVKEPQTYSEAMDSSESGEWLNAITEELNALERNNTWLLVNRTDNMKIIGHKWVFPSKMQQLTNQGTRPGSVLRDFSGEGS